MVRLNGNIRRIRGIVLIPVVFVIALAVLIVLAILPNINLTTINNARDLLESRGYWVLAQNECYPSAFIPCNDGTQDLGSLTNRWRSIYLSAPTIYLGDVTISNSGSQIDIDGQLVMHGGGKVWMEVQPDLDYATVVASGKPTQVYRGVSSGFSLPIYNNDDEELFTSIDVPREWDGITNPIVHIHCYIPNSGVGVWISPNSFIDYGGWIDETLAYDNDNKTFAYNSVAGASWSSFLEFGIAEALYDKVRFYAKYDAVNINTIDIDAYYSGVWNDIYQGAYESMAWVSKDLGGSHSINKYRIRFYNVGVNPKDARLYETSLCAISGQGNFNLELGWNNYTVADHDPIPDTANLETEQIGTVVGSFISYRVDIEINQTDLTTCDQLDLRLRRINATENEVDEEVIITHIGIQFLRDKLGEVVP